MTRTNLLRAPHLRDHRLDMIDRRLRHDAVAEIEDVRAAAGGAQDRVDAVPERIAAGDERQRIEVALRREPLRKLGQEQVRLERPVERDRVGKAGLDARERGWRRRRGRTRSPWPAAVRAFSPCTICRIGSSESGSNSAGGNAAPKLSKICTASAPASICADQIGDRGRDEPVDERSA